MACRTISSVEWESISKSTVESWVSVESQANSLGGLKILLLLSGGSGGDGEQGEESEKSLLFRQKKSQITNKQKTQKLFAQNVYFTPKGFQNLLQC